MSEHELDDWTPAADDEAWLVEQLRESENGASPESGPENRTTLGPPDHNDGFSPAGMGGGTPDERKWSGGPVVYKGPLDGPDHSSVVPADPAAGSEPVRPRLVVVEARAFAAVEEASAEALLGASEQTLLAADDTVVMYGDGGAGKTTLTIDEAFHVCSGTDWLGLEVRRPVRGIWIENEGPRGKFRTKLDRKFDEWDGPKVDLHVVEEPWSLFSFADDGLVAELVAYLVEFRIEVVFAGPVQRLGVEGGGTPAEIDAFVRRLQLIRAELARPLAFQLVHHENKSGDVSGAWAGVPDTLAHVQARGNGHTAVVWRKCRWSSELHGKTWNLNWRDGQSFERDETPQTTREEIAEAFRGLLTETPDKSWRYYRDRLPGGTDDKTSVRDEMLRSKEVVNKGKSTSHRYFLRSQVGDELDLEANNDAGDAGGEE